ncbi:exopolysaccharide biosynthesis polyprenyl glycosylphosphotransferase [Microlunatus lacustris]
MPQQPLRTPRALPTVTGEPRQRDPLWTRLLSDGVRPLFIAGDLAAVALASLARPVDVGTAGAFALLMVLFLAQLGLYRSRLALLLLDDLPRIAAAWIVTVALVLVGIQLVQNRFVDLTWSVLVLVALVVVRGLNYFGVRVLRSRGVVSHGTLIVGAGHTGRVLAELLWQHPESGLRLLGHLDLEAEVDRKDLGKRTPLLGRPEDVAAVLENVRPRVLIVAHGMVPEDQLVELVRACHRQRCEVFVVPRLHEVQHVGSGMDFIGDMPLVRLQRAAHRSGSWRFKRMFDAVFAGIALVLLAPLLAVCALAVRLEGGKGVIFRQQRVGVDGKLFQLMKFRSLRPVDESESQTNWNISHDDRLGPVGRFLRKSSIDELPQLFNILRGDMSFVGPRPERPHFVEQFDLLYRGYNARHRVPSGLTGWAQVHGLRGDTSIDERARFDNFYIENWSLWLDFRILLRTAVSVFTSPGA